VVFPSVGGNMVNNEKRYSRVPRLSGIRYSS